MDEEAVVDAIIKITRTAVRQEMLRLFGLLAEEMVEDETGRRIVDAHVLARAMYRFGAEQAPSTEVLL